MTDRRRRIDVTLSFGLAGKRAVVVGGGLGIGRDTALCLGAAGATVVCVDIDAGRAANVRDEIVNAGGRASSFDGDVTTRHVVEKLCDDVANRFGGADIVIDIVGVASNLGILDMTDDVWDENFRLNLRHNFLVTQVFARHMRDTNIAGSIVHIASAVGFVPHTGSVAYSAAKAGLISLIQSSAVELAPHSIRVNGVAPGVIDTPRRRPTFSPNASSASLEKVPMKRYGSTHEIANVAVFLASDLASYITGQTYLVDGGAMSTGPFPSALPRPESATAG